MKYLVTMNVPLCKIKANNSRIPEGSHGLLATTPLEGYAFRSRYPFVVGWTTDLDFKELKAAQYALIEVGEARLLTKAGRHSDGEVYTVLGVFQEKPESLDEGVEEITLQAMLAAATQYKMQEKKYSRNVGARMESEDQYDYLVELGDGNASEGLRRLVAWAIKKKPKIKSS